MRAQADPALLDLTTVHIVRMSDFGRAWSILGVAFKITFCASVTAGLGVTVYLAASGL